MALPASQQTLDNALTALLNAANKAKNAVQSLRDQSATGSTVRVAYIEIQRELSSALSIWDAAAAVPGIVQYAKDQFDDQTLDIVAEYNAMRAAAVSLRQWIFDNIPKQGTTPLLITLNLDGSFSQLTFTTGQTSGFRTEADAFIATIG